MRNSEIRKWDPEKLKILREHLHLSRHDVSAGTGISEAALRKYEEYPITIPGLEAIIKLSLFFGCSSDYFLGLMDEEEEKKLLEDDFKAFENNRKLLFEEANNKQTNSSKYCKINGMSAPYPYNLIEDIFGYETNDITKVINIPILPDQEKGLEHILNNNLTERSKDILQLYYKEGKTLREIADSYSISKERVNQIMAKALRTLRHPSSSHYIKYGLRENIIKIENTRLDLMEDSLDKRLNELEEKRKKIKNFEEEIEDKNTTDAMVFYHMDLKRLGLSIRPYNCLKRRGCLTVSDVIKLEKEDVLHTVRNLGKKSYDEIITKLRKIGAV